MSGRFIEIALRGVAIASGVGALVAACFTVNRLESVPGDVQSIITFFDPNVIQYTQASGALGIAMGALSLFAALSIILRIGNFKKLGVFAKVFLLVDLVVICICLVGFGAGGVIGAIGANTWSSQIVDPINSLPPLLRNFLQPVIEIRDALAATAAVSLFATLVFAVLGFWMLLFAVRHWNGQLKYNSYI